MEETLYAHADVLGSLTYLTKDDGGGYLAFDYGPWGEIDPSQTLNEFDFVVTAAYTGHDYYFVLDVWFAQARLYNAESKRFGAVDAVKDGSNWYVYCADNPIVYTDPSGCFNKGDTLKKGDGLYPITLLSSQKAWDVNTLQRRLQDLGPLSKSFTKYGYFDDMTEKAVTKYKNSIGRYFEGGVVDEALW